MVITKRYLMLLCFSVGGFLSQGYAATADKPVEISFQFSVFARSELANLVYIPHAKQSAEAVRFYSSSRSPIYNYRGVERIAFYESVDGDLAPKNAMPAEAKPVAVYDVPSGMKRGLLLFFPRSVINGDGIKYEVYGINDAIDKIPGGHVVIVNASMASYAGAIGSRVISIPLGVSEPYPAKTQSLLRLWRVDRPNSAPVIQESWTLADRQRLIMVLFPPYSPTGRTPIVRRLDDVLPPEVPGIRVAQP